MGLGFGGSITHECHQALRAGDPGYRPSVGTFHEDRPNSSFYSDFEGYSRDWLVEQSFKQHPCLVTILQSERRRPGGQRCLVLSQLFSSLHWGLHRAEHELFWRHLHLSSDVHAAVSNLPRRAGVRLEPPYAAMHLRTWFLRAGNGTALASDLARGLRGALEELSRSWPESRGPDKLFIATDNVEAQLVRWVGRAAQAAARSLTGKDIVVFTSADTQEAAGRGTHRHIALDVLLCARAAAFIGTGASTATTVISAMRRVAPERAGASQWVYVYVYVCICV